MPNHRRRKCLAAMMFGPALLAVRAEPINSRAFAQPLEAAPPQTEGPYYPRTKPSETDSDLTRLGRGPTAQGEILELSGTIVDPAGSPIAGARVEIWQTDHSGIYDHPRDPGRARRDKAFQGYGAVTTAVAGSFAFQTILPGRYGARPRHIHVKVTPPVGPTLTTQLYFQGDAELKTDGIAASLGPRLQHLTLTSVRAASRSGPLQAKVRLVVPRGR